jgi:hypothetical protein
MKIGVVVTFNEPYSDMANVSVYKNIQHYCLIHKYELYVDHQKSSRMTRCGAWNKIIACIEALPSYDWIFFIDVDCLIMNQTIKLEDIIDENYSFIIPTHGSPAPDNPVLNDFGNDCVITSQFLVKNDEIGMRILEDIWEAKEWPESMDINTFDYEGRQTRITTNKPEFKNHVKIVKENILNTFWHVNNPFVLNHSNWESKNVWKPNDFIVHVTNYPIKEREILLDKLNFFSGGLVTCFIRTQNKIKFSSLIELSNVVIVINDSNHIPLINYKFDKISPKISYILFTNNEIDNMDIIVKSYSDNKIISLKYLPCKN